MNNKTQILYICIVLVLCIIIYSEILLKMMQKRFSLKEGKSKLCGQEIASKTANRSEGDSFYIIKQNGGIDHYDAKRKVIRLNGKIFDGTNIFAQSVAYLLAGFLRADTKNNSIYNIKNWIYPRYYLASNIGSIVAIISITLGISNYRDVSLSIAIIGLIIYLCNVYTIKKIIMEDLNIEKDIKDTVIEVYNTYRTYNINILISLIISIIILLFM